MPKIKMRASVSCGNPYFEYRQGEVVEVDDYWAARLVNRRVADLIPEIHPVEQVVYKKPPIRLRKRK